MRPALTPDQWSKRSTGVVSIHVSDEETQLVVRGPNDEATSVSGADHFWRLVALANDALPARDARKVTTEDVAALRLIAASIGGEETEGTGEGQRRELLALAEALCAKIAALLPPR